MVKDETKDKKVPQWLRDEVKRISEEINRKRPAGGLQITSFEISKEG